MSRALRRSMLSLAVLLLTMGRLSAAADGDEEPVRAGRLNEFGLELGLIGSPADTASFAIAASGGLEYERHLCALPALSAGLWLQAAGFRPLADYYSQSFMCYGGVEFSWTFPLFEIQESETAGSAFSLKTVLRAGWYLRNITIDNTDYWGSRPFAALGLRLILSWDRLASALSLYAAVPVDKTPAILLWLTESLSLRM